MGVRLFFFLFVCLITVDFFFFFFGDKYGDVFLKRNRVFVLILIYFNK